MHEECKNFCLNDRTNWEINDKFGGCGRDEKREESNVSYDLVDLLPVDPFEMNLETTLWEMDLGTKISAALAGWIEASNDDYEASCDAIVADLSYYWSKAVLSSFETQLNPGSYVVDFCNRDFSGSGIEINEDESFGAAVTAEQVPVAGKSNATIHPCGDGIKISAAIAERIGASNYDYEVNGDSFIADLSYYWSKAVLSSFETQLNPGSYVTEFSNMSFSGSGIDVYEDESFGAVVAAEQVPTGKNNVIHSCGDESFVHEGLILSLGYLGVQDLISVERVCRSLRTAVQNDPLLWRCIHIDSPLGDKITDAGLYQLAQRSQGSLQCLSLLRCPNITQDGLMRVLGSNLRLKKLGVSGCLRLTVKGLINILKTFKLSGVAGINTLILGRLFIASPEQFEELKLLVGINELHHTKAHKLKFYHNSIPSVACDDDRAIDIEACPVCQKCRLVFDCPLESCRSMGPENCRACNACIPRCAQCGKCINNCEYVETFCLECVCLDCWKYATESEEAAKEN